MSVCPNQIGAISDEVILPTWCEILKNYTFHITSDKIVYFYVRYTVIYKKMSVKKTTHDETIIWKLKVVLVLKCNIKISWWLVNL